MTTDKKMRITDIVAEWRKGCSLAAPRECMDCTMGALWAIEAIATRVPIDGTSYTAGFLHRVAVMAMKDYAATRENA